MSEFQLYLLSYLKLSSILEILILTLLIYLVLKWIRGTQAEQVVKGLLVILILMPVMSWLGFTTLSFLLQNLITWIFIFIVVLFQPELRLFLEQLGSGAFRNTLNLKRKQDNKEIITIRNIVKAVNDLAKTKTGALIICIARTGLRDIEETGTIIDSKVDPLLIANIFYPNTPLHDGAIIISVDYGQIEAAGCVLPLTNRRDLPQQFGTRHRAGIGLAEQSDAIVIIVSEETGKVTVAKNNEYIKDISSVDLEKLLIDEYVRNDFEEDNKSESKTV